MSKKNKKLKIENKAEEKKPRKNRLLPSLALAGLIALGGAISYLHFNKKQDYTEWYNSQMHQEESQHLVHPSFLEKCNPSEDEKDKIKSGLIKQLGFQPKIISEEFYAGNTFIELKRNSRTIKEYKQKSKSSIDDFFSYLGEKSPKVEFHVLSRNSKIIPSTDKIEIYIVNKIFENNALGKYCFKFKDRELWALASDEKYSSGEFTHNMNFNFFPDRNPAFILEEENTSPILISTSNNEVECFSSPLAETLHYNLKGIRLTSTLLELNQRWLSRGKPKKYNSEELTKVVQEKLQIEEGVVHALVNSFIEEKKEKYGFRNNNIQEYFSSGMQNPRYADVPRNIKKIKEIGARKFLESYKSKRN